MNNNVTSPPQVRKRSKKRVCSLSEERIKRSQADMRPPLKFPNRDQNPQASDYRVSHESESPSPDPASHRQIEYLGRSAEAAARNRAHQERLRQQQEIDMYQTEQRMPRNRTNNNNNAEIANNSAQRPKNPKNGATGTIGQSSDPRSTLSAESRKIVKDLEQLTLEERREAFVVDEEKFGDLARREVDCVGCLNRLIEYFNELINLARKRGKGINFEGGFVVTPDRLVGIAENYVANTSIIATIIQHYKNKNVETIPYKSKVQYRCFLHSKKPIPNYIWREALQSILIEHDLPEQCIASLAEIDESTYMMNLRNHLKRRKFCSTCKDNILGAYENLIESASKMEDEMVEDEEEEEEEEGQDDDGRNCEEYAHEMHHSDGECAYEMTADGHDGIDYNSRELQQSMQRKMIVKSDGDEACYENIVRPHEHTCDDFETSSNAGDLISTIRFCPERRKIILPLQMEAFTEFLNKAEIDLCLQSKHASTREAAQEELLICLGITLKDKLQSLWRDRKSEEMTRILFLRISALGICEQIETEIQNKYIRLGHKTLIEEYLNDTEAAAESRKEKLKKKRIKKKEKKRLQKRGDPVPGQPSNGQGGKNRSPSTNEDTASNATAEDAHLHNHNTNTNNTSVISASQSLNGEKGHKNCKSLPPSSDDHSVPAKSKIKTTCTSPNSNSKIEMLREKESEKHIINKGGTHISLGPTSSTSASVENGVESGSRRELQAWAEAASQLSDREKRLLLSMGWTESMDESSVDESEIKRFKEKWKEIKAKRDNFRRDAREKFQRLLAQASTKL
eukprot:TRINITY_DN1059_c0_g2_i4.p1 TRINITY_DN1059_c0_g2~~TRINITY_DN1059_c0_g2_i4.p1  ORF type:complete len:796 (-),score=170.43 TRINITY_DN1059_c0_g2_i4:456-2843(-)